MRFSAVGFSILIAFLAVIGCDRSPTSPPAKAGGAVRVRPAADPDLPWLELTGLRFQGTAEGGQTTYELTLEGIEARYWPHPDFAPGPDWEPLTQWLQFVKGSSGGQSNLIEGGRIQQTPQGIFGVGKIEVGVTGTYTTPNGSERIFGTLTFDLEQGLIVPIKGGPFFEPCGILCIDFGVEARFDPAPIFNLPPDIGLFGEVIGRLIRPLAAISAGGSHTCGLFVGGHAYCWGDNISGQLGDGTRTDRSTPVPVSGGHSFTAISAGTSHTCALTSAGQAYCWGINNHGQLGDGTNASKSEPGIVSGGHTFMAIDAGWDHTCGLTTEGAAYCWGDNEYGVLGDGTFDARSTPTPVFFGSSYAAISAGAEQTCAIDSAGNAYCWGSNQFGQLGLGPGWDADSRRNVPDTVVGGRTFTKIASGGDHTCAVTAAGDAYCWGLGDFGQLGNGSTVDQGIPTLVAGGHMFTDVSAGTDHTCGLATGNVLCWGYNHFGQLGDGTSTDKTVPSFVSGEGTFAVLSAGAYHNCGLRPSGTPYCWGRNADGELGDGTTRDSSRPIPVLFF
jgi:alpha-tubulin suppressor-like RCC1 family protein